MTAIAPPIIRCPVCESDGDMLHHDIRAPLVYSCRNCLHEWEIARAEEPPDTEPTTAEQPPTPLASTNRLHPRKL